MWKNILRRSGLILVTIGILELGYSIWSFTQKQNYSSFVDLFGIVGGLFLIFGGLKSAKWIYRIIFFYISSIAASTIGLFAVFPASYLIAWSTNHKVAVVIAVCNLAAMLWVALQLERPEVTEEQAKNSIRSPGKTLPLIIGIATAVVTTSLSNLTLKSATAKEAVKVARENYGPDMTYVPVGIKVSYVNFKKTVWVNVVGYNSTTFEPIRIQLPSSQ